ncbi:3'-5' exonuclease [Stenotrophomonas maltophilia]|nr:3'-5' exonuclease [Stenotrophomonas maltophilia]
MKASLLKKLIVVDTETTGANVFTNSILSYAFVPMTCDDILEGYVDDFSGQPWSEVAESYFRETKEEWSVKKRSASAALQAIEAYLSELSPGEDMMLVGHNVAFDRYFLERMAFEAGRSRIAGLSHRSIDTHSLLMSLSIMGLIPESATSSSGAFKYFGIRPPSSKRHTAIGDAIATRRLFSLIIENFDCSSVVPSMNGPKLG